MSPDPALFSKASTLIHFLQGSAVLLLGVCEVYVLPGGKKWLRAAGPAALLLAGIGGLAVILAIPGGWSPAEAGRALAERKGFQIFVGLSCLFMAAGLSGLMAVPEGAAGERWRKVFAGSLVFIAVLYLLVPWRMNEAARAHALATHCIAGGALLLGVAAGLARAVTGRGVFLRAGAFLFIIAAVQLLWYREVPAAYGPYIVTFTSEDAGGSGYMPPSRPPSDASTADKERAGR